MTSALGQSATISQEKLLEIWCTARSDYDKVTYPFVYKCFEAVSTELAACHAKEISSSPLFQKTREIENVLEFLIDVTKFRDMKFLQTQVPVCCLPDAPPVLMRCDESITLSQCHIKGYFDSLQEKRDDITVLSRKGSEKEKAYGEKIGAVLDNFISQCREAFIKGPEIAHERRPDGCHTPRARYQSTLTFK